MFGWLKNWRNERRLRERAIFSYYDGRRQRHIDPIPAARELEHELGAEWPKLLRTLTAPIPGVPAGVDISNVLKAHQDAQTEAARKLSAAVCLAFGVTQLDDSGNGLTEGERIGLAARFFSFLADLKDLASPFVTSPSPTG